MSGKGLAFLNKKGFHPSTLKNQERVWKAEQQAASEEKRIAEIKKQYEEERKLQELYQMKEAALPQTKKQERLDWMYQGSAAWKNEQQEAQLLGQKPAELPKEDAKADSKGLGLFAQKTQNPVQDAWSKLRDDPLLEIKKREQAAKQQIKQNPVKMEKILKALKEDIGKDKKEKKHKDKHHKRSRSRSASPVRNASPPRARSPPRSNGNHHSDSQHHSHFSHDRHRDELRERDDRRDREHRDRRSPARSDHHDRHDHRDRERERSDRDRERERGRDRSRSRSPRRERSPARRRSRSPPRTDPQPQAQAKVPAQASQVPSSAANTRVLSPPYQRPYKRHAGGSTSSMTEEERQQRLEQMKNNAKLHEEKTARRLAAAAEEDKREKEEEAKRIDQQNAELRPEFLEAVNKKVYGGNTSVEERLSRGAHFRQRPIDLESKGVAHV